jgi:hypothetical protein
MMIRDRDMTWYRPAGQDFYFASQIPELASFERTRLEQGEAPTAIPLIPPAFVKNNESGAASSLPAPQVPVCQMVGWVAGAQRQVETWSAPPGMLVRVAGGSDFYIGPGGQEILFASQEQDSDGLDETDRQILLGPVLVLALALRGCWSLHASAAIFNDTLVVFLGESGQGKSTLAGYLANEAGWRLAADDILPVTIGPNGLQAWPHFPQLKLPMQAQPGAGLPEQLPFRKVCLLEGARVYDMPALQRMSSTQAIQVYLGHTAGSRLFEPDLLKKHLAFCSQAAEKAPVYRLVYPHRWEGLRIVQELLESIC